MSKSTLYLDLIVENLNGQRMYSGKDEHSDQIYKYNNIREKLDSVINKSIFLLRKGAFTEVDLRLPEKILTDLPMNTGHYRTICLLVSFKYFLNNQNNNTISNILNGVHDISLNTNNLYVSIPLLLLQSIRLSQIEWDSNRYCYEYFSSKIATSHLSTTLDQIQKADKESKDIVKMIFEQVIRWHTLLGQCNRGTASFCIPDQWQDLQGLLNSFYPDKHSIINRNQNYLMIIPVLLKIFEVLDNILRIENSKYEKYIKKYLKIYNLKGEKFITSENLLYELKLNNVSVAMFSDINITWNQQYIFSYVRPSGEYVRNISNIAQNHYQNQTNYREIIEEIKKKINTPPNNNIYNIIINRKQRNMGFVRKLISNLKHCSFLYKRDLPQMIKIFEVPSTHGSINLFHVFFRPIMVAKELGLISKNASHWKDDNPITFLSEALKNAKELTMPIVKRITDLLEFYYFQSKYNPEYTNQSCFRLTILINEYHQIKIWLPEISNCKELDIAVRNNVTIKDVLFRFINYTVSNYGMTLEYNSVDFSLTENESFWIECISPTYRETLGLHVFDGYLLDCCSEVINETRSKKEFKAALENKMLTEMFFKEENLDLTDKCIIGIDIGGTEIKIQFFEIKFLQSIVKSDKLYRLSNNYYLKPKKSFAFKTDRNNKKRDPKENDFSTCMFNKLLENNDQFVSKNDHYVYEDADDFANYLIEQISRNIGDISYENIISIGCCWPGPIKNNKIVSTSGLLAKFKGFSHQILLNRRRQIVELNLANSLKKIWEQKKGNRISVHLVNDGDSESAGLVFAKTHSLSNDQNEKFRSFFDETIAIVKLGTGTAGSIISYGKIMGLNEYGKFINTLDHDNTANEKKHKKNRFPEGDINKQLSIKAFRNMMKELGADNVAEITGRDIDLLLSDLVTDKYKLFGVLELVSKTSPDLKWDDLVEYNSTTRQYEVMNKTIEKTPLSWKIVGDNSDIDEYTWFHLQQFFESNGNYSKLLNHTNCSLDDVLESLGKLRITRLNLKPIESSKIKDIGSKLADLIAGINDTLPSHLKPLKAVVAAGGILQSTAIKTKFIEGFKANVIKYLYDNNFQENKLINEFKDTVNLEDSKFYYLCDGMDYARLGAAVLGFDHYINNQKLNELISIKKKSLNNEFITTSYSQECRYLKVEEASSYLVQNKGRLKISVNTKEKTVKTLI